MLAAAATSIHPDAPLDGLTVGDMPDPVADDGWVRVGVRAASLNHHDLWSLKGVGLPAERLPMILGCDASGVLDDGSEVIVHGVIPACMEQFSRRDTPHRWHLLVLKHYK